MKIVKYFARLRIVNDYPENGTVQWCVVDNLGGAVVVSSEQSARTTAAKQNAEVAERIANGTYPK
jgi:hypothetical protein